MLSKNSVKKTVAYFFNISENLQENESSKVVF